MCLCLLTDHSDPSNHMGSLLYETRAVRWSVQYPRDAKHPAVCQMELSLLACYAKREATNRTGSPRSKCASFCQTTTESPPFSKFGLLARWSMAPDSQSHLLVCFSREASQFCEVKTIDTTKFRTPRVVCACALYVLLSAYRAPFSHLLPLCSSRLPDSPKNAT